MIILNDDAKILDANAEAARIFELDDPKLLGRSLAEFLPAETDFETA